MDAILSVLNEHGVIPDVLNSGFIPSFLLCVSYPSGVDVHHGNVLTPTQVQSLPNVRMESAESGKLYTIVMTDPDAPTRSDPVNGEFLHWIRINVPGDHLAAGATSDAGEDLAQYVGSGPPPGSGLHRYIFTVFEQPADKASVLSADPRLTNRSAEGRRKWKMTTWAENFGLTPLAANFYQAEWDEYVPRLYEQLSGK